MKKLIDKGGKVNFFTRPRRFGKSMNMSMLQHFFEIGANKTLFEGLNIAKEKELCEKYQGKYPVVSVSLKDVNGLNFESACNKLKCTIGMEALRFSFLAKSEKLENAEKEMYKDLIKVENGVFAMTEDALGTSLWVLSKLLAKYYGCPVILLIDEYDVPLDKAFQNGFYDEMLSVIRSMLSMALKTNTSLEFAVLTGCLRIAKESIFTGLTNFKVFSLTDVRFDEYFGFTDEEVKQMLAYYDLSDKFEEIKEWYDGYTFGNVSVYCPWDVINYCEDLLEDSNTKPKAYWMNTSGNAFAKAFKTGDVETIETMFQAYLKKTISIRDTSVAKPKKENFYHGILLGLFAPMRDWLISSNAESGEGYSDILIETEDETGIVIEVKYGDKGKLEDACKDALVQIKKKNYVEKLEDDGIEKILKYGIGCYQKKCKVVLE